MPSAYPAPPTLASTAHRVAAGTVPARPTHPSMTNSSNPSKPREFCIQGLTKAGRSLRPSDWAERLASAMSCVRPEGSVGGIGAFIGYSPYCVPTSLGDVKAVIVNEALREIEPMAWDFVINFARDNDLQMGEVCVLPQAPTAKP